MGTARSELPLVALAMAASLLGAAPAEAQQRMPYYRPHDRASLTLTADKVSQPPPQYAGTYRGKLTVITLPRAQTTARCYAMGARASFLACTTRSLRGPDQCIMVLPAVGDGITPAIQAAVRRHELGHCNGWPSDHRP